MPPTINHFVDDPDLDPKLNFTFNKAQERTGASGETVPDIRIGWVIEDPIFRVSSDSIFIQSADVIAYTLKEKDFPQTSRKKFQADRIFERKLEKVCFKSQFADEDGIIRA